MKRRNFYKKKIVTIIFIFSIGIIGFHFIRANLFEDIKNIKVKIKKFRKKVRGIGKKIKSSYIEKQLKKIGEIIKSGFEKVLKRKIISPTESYNDNIKDDVRLNVPVRIFSHNSFQYSGSIQKVLGDTVSEFKIEDIVSDNIVKKIFRKFSINERYSLGQALHEYTVYEQLIAGVRFLDIRIWSYKGELVVSHGSPTSKLQKIVKPNGKFITLKTIFNQIVQFLEDDLKVNKKAAVLIIKVAGDRIKNVGEQKFEELLKETDLDKYILTPKDWSMESKDKIKHYTPEHSFYGKFPKPLYEPIEKEILWPTYGWMRSTGKRVVLLSDPTKWSYSLDKYFLQPGWDVYPADKNSFLIYSIGLETNINMPVKKIVERFEKYGELGYDAIYGISSLSVPFLHKLRDPNQGIRNSIVIKKYIDYLITNGYRVLNNDGTLKKILWKGKYPSAIGGDSIGARTGNLQKIANDFNKSLDLLEE